MGKSIAHGRFVHSVKWRSTPASGTRTMRPISLASQCPVTRWRNEMLKRGLHVSVALAAMGLSFTTARAQRAPSDTRAAQASLVKEVKEHIDKARAAAGKEWPWFQQMLCSNPQLGGDVIGMFFAASRLTAADADFEPVRAFDNLYYVGL